MSFPYHVCYDCGHWQKFCPFFFLLISLPSIGYSGTNCLEICVELCTSKFLAWSIP